MLNYSIHLMDMLLSSFLAIFKHAEVDNYNNCRRRAGSLNLYYGKSAALVLILSQEASKQLALLVVTGS